MLAAPVQSTTSCRTLPCQAPGQSCAPLLRHSLIRPERTDRQQLLLPPCGLEEGHMRDCIWHCYQRAGSLHHAAAFLAAG